MNWLRDYCWDLAGDPLSWVLLAVVVAGLVLWAPTLVDHLRARRWPKQRR
jgi:hypothetical protein